MVRIETSLADHHDRTRNFAVVKMVVLTIWHEHIANFADNELQRVATKRARYMLTPARRHDNWCTTKVRPQADKAYSPLREWTKQWAILCGERSEGFPDMGA